MNPNSINKTLSLKPLFDYLQKQKEDQKFLKYLEITATFVLIIFFMLFAIRPTILTISSLIGDIESKKLLKQELKTKINKIVQAQEQFSTLQGKYRIIDSSLPERPRYYDAVAQIQKVSTNSGTTVDKFGFDLNSVGTSLLDPNLKTYTVTLNLNGQFSSAVDQASQLLKNRRLLNINSLNFGNNIVENKQSSSSATISNGVKTSFSATFYYWPNTNEKK